MKAEFDTQASANPAWRINLDAWEHFPKPGQIVPEGCQIRPHYNGEGKWECAQCDVRVRVRE